MDTTTFSAKVREKFPTGVAADGRAYKDIPDAELTHKMVEKYPVYKDQITDYKPYTGNLNDQLFGKSAVQPEVQSAQGKEVAQDLAGKGKAALMGAGSFMGGEPITSPAIDYAGKKIVEHLPEDFTMGGLTKQQMLENLDKGTPLHEQYKNMAGEQAHPESYLGGEIVGGVATLPKELLATGAKFAAKEATPIVAKGSEILSKGGDVVSDVVSGIKSKLPKMPLTVKSDAEILATSENNLSKLTPTQRSRYFDLQSGKLSEEHNAAQEAIKKTASETEAKIVAESDARMTALKDETKQLDNELSTKSIEEAQSLKPKVLETMRKNSDEYRKMVDAEIAPVRESYVDDKVIIDSINKKFPSDPYSADPYKADRIIKEMGLQEGNTKKVGELYDAIKAEKAGISSGATKGNKVFSSSDMETTEKISALSEALEEAGVDLSKANSFWKNYAPMRDKLIKSVQPFTPIGAEGGSFNTFTNVIKTSLTKPDPKNANFIKATEDMLGVKIGNPETRATFEKLSQTQKAQVAANLEKEAKLVAEKKAAEIAKVNANKTYTDAQKALKIKEVTAQQKADNRRKIIVAIEAVLGTGAGIGLYNTIFH